MSKDHRLACDRFPLSSGYHPDWQIASASGGANSLWLTEWLCEKMTLTPGMRVLDLGCGRAASSIFLHREFGAEVWAADLWFSPTENAQRIRDAGAERSVFPIYANARALPFADEFFDAIISIDAFVYFGTDDYYLNHLARFIRPGGQVGIVGAGIMNELSGPIPAHLAAWWSQDQLWCFHSAAWWKRQWEKTGLVEIEVADSMQDGWRRWIDWQKVIAPDNQMEIEALESDQGKNLGYFRVVGRRKSTMAIDTTAICIPPNYVKASLRRDYEN